MLQLSRLVGLDVPEELSSKDTARIRRIAEAIAEDEGTDTVPSFKLGPWTISVMIRDSALWLEAYLKDHPLAMAVVAFGFSGKIEAGSDPRLLKRFLGDFEGLTLG